MNGDIDSEKLSTFVFLVTLVLKQWKRKITIATSGNQKNKKREGLKTENNSVPLQWMLFTIYSSTKTHVKQITVSLIAVCECGQQKIFAHHLCVSMPEKEWRGESKQIKPRVSAQAHMNTPSTSNTMAENNTGPENTEDRRS